MKLKLIGGLFFGVALILGLMIGCGKVSQVTEPEADTSPSFDLTYSVELMPTSDLLMASGVTGNVPSPISSANYILVTDNVQIYVQVSRLQMDNATPKWVDLSWGTGVFSVVNTGVGTASPTLPLTVSINSIVETSPPLVLVSPNAGVSTNTMTGPGFLVKCFDRNGVARAMSDLSWSVMSYDQTLHQAQISSRKIKLGSNRYLVQVFSDQHHYYLSVLDSSDILSTGPTALGSLTLYDTFLATLYLMQISEHPSEADTLTVSNFKDLFTADFFERLSYIKPRNVTASWDPKHPGFVFDRLLEKTLLQVYSLEAKSPASALLFVKGIDVNVINSKARDILVRTIQDLNKGSGQ